MTSKTGRLMVSAAALALALPFVPALAGGRDAAAPAASPEADPAIAKARALVASMTLEEKLPQLLNVAPAIPRLNVPAYNWWTESLHGALGPLPTTNFPEPIALAASFDAPLVQDVAGAISVEVRALHTLARQTGRTGRMGSGLDTWSPTSTSSAIRAGDAARKPMARIRSSPPAWAWPLSAACRDRTPIARM